MRETSLKLSFLVVVLLVAFSSFLLPFTAEARHKHLRNKNCHHHRRRPPVSPPQPPIPAPTPPPNAGVPPYQIHGCGYPCSDSNDCDWPCTICCANQTCCYDEPFFPPLPPLALSPSIEPPTTTAPTPEPYQNHGCGYPCFDSNDCDWPCTICGSNYTCSYDEPFLPPIPSPAPSPSIEEAPMTTPTPEPYQIHGCGYPCSDSNDCDWPCTICGANNTCSYDEPFFPPTPTLAPSPSIEAPTWPPNDGIEIPPYEIHGCGYPCTDSNDCDWPCTICGANNTCSYDEPFFPPTPTPAPSPSIEAPTSPPTDGIEIPPYEIHGCGYPCSDSNDCDWPCTVCCANRTCCQEEPVFIFPVPPLSSPSPSPAPILLPLAPSPSVDEAPASAPNDGVAVPRYPIPGGCGWRCSDSNDCNWPCTECCPDHTCCYEQAWPPMF